MNRNQKIYNEERLILINLQMAEEIYKFWLPALGINKKTFTSLSKDMKMPEIILNLINEIKIKYIDK